MYHEVTPTRRCSPVRGRQDPQVAMLHFVDLDARVPPDHPLRTIF